MKERDHKRKMQMKKERQQIVMRKQLHSDISVFLIDMTAAMEPSADAVLYKALKEGFRGFDRWRGKDLVKCFDKYYAVLRDVKHPLPMYHEVVKAVPASRWSHPHGHWRQLRNDKEKQRAHEELMFESDVLMSRLMELAFDLDIDE